MSDLASTDPVYPASAPLALARRVRIHLAGLSTGPTPEALERIMPLVAAADALETFSEAILDDLHDAIAWCEAAVAAGTTTHYETYDSWDEDLHEGSFAHSVRILNPEAQQIHALLVDIRQMADLVEQTLDLVAAHAIIVGLRSARSMAAGSWHRPSRP